MLQSELNSTYPELHISILGINEVGHEAGNSVISQGRDLPWLQSLDDGPSAAARELWQATFRDVVILDGENVQVGVYNLTQNDLADPQSYDTLREMLVDAAMEYQKPWRNSLNPLDVNNDGHISPIDALLVINALNRDGSHRLPPPTTTNTAPPYFDTNGDGFISPVDALMVINALIRPSGMKGEGESPPSAGAAAAVFPVESGLQREPLPPMTTNPGPPERLPRPLPVALDDSRPIGPVLQPDEVRDSVFADPLLDWFVLDDESLSTEY